MSRGNPESGSVEDPGTLFERRPWGWSDLAALAVWTLAIAIVFRDVVGLRGTLFYFDITEINYPYRAFFAEELKAGRFSRWCPGLYCGLPLYSESQAGYLHPFKYLFYPWLETWQALNLDTVLSVWLTGVGTYLWLRRHVGPAGALTGAAIFGLSGYTWAHLIHTSMINALASVPFIIWGLESSWSSGRWRGAVLGGLALACQVFAGHLQDALFAVMLVGLYGLYRAATEHGRKERVRALVRGGHRDRRGRARLGGPVGPVEGAARPLPRAGGLEWWELVKASWHPELLPTVVLREAYGTRARDTDWPDGFYPYHEMNTYMGLIAMALAVVGAGGPGARDRWTNFWVILVGLGAILMLGKFTFLFDRANRIPVLGSSREPVRFHLWVALGVAALAAVGVERLGRPGAVSLRGGLILAGVLIAASIPIVLYIYSPIWIDPNQWHEKYHLDRYRWLGRELTLAVTRTALLAAAGWLVARTAARTTDLRRRARWAAILPLLVLVDLLAAHWYDVVTESPRYWTEPPVTARLLREDPSFVRVVGVADKASGEPGYVSEPVDFLSVRDSLGWSLPLVWHLPSSTGNTPMYSRRLHDFGDPLGRLHSFPWRFELEGDTHILNGKGVPGATGKEVGSASSSAIPEPCPRGSWAGRSTSRTNARRSPCWSRWAVRTSSAIAWSSRYRRTRSNRRRWRRARRGSSRICRSASSSRPTCKRPATSSWPTRSTPVGRRATTAARADPAGLRRLPGCVPAGGPSHGHLHLPAGRLRPWPGALGDRDYARVVAVRPPPTTFRPVAGSCTARLAFVVAKGRLTRPGLDRAGVAGLDWTRLQDRAPGSVEKKRPHVHVGGGRGGEEGEPQVTAGSYSGLIRRAEPPPGARRSLSFVAPLTPWRRMSACLGLVAASSASA